MTLPMMQTPEVQKQLDDITNQTMQLAKDATTTGWTTADGLYGYGLEPVAKLIYPFVTPFLNSIPRKKAKEGSDAARWKAIVGYGYKKTRPTQGFGYAGQQVTTVEQDFVAPYALLTLGDIVSMDAQNMAEGFDNLKAKSTVKTLYELKIGEDIVALGGQRFALQTPAAPTGTYSSTGGTITNGGGAAVNWKFAVAVRPIEGYHYGDTTATGDQLSTVASATVTVAVPAGATTGSVALTVNFVAGAVEYDWYTDNGAGGNLLYLGSTTVNTYTATAASASDVNPPAADGSADNQAFNGFLASLVGDYSDVGQVKRGTGTRSSGATIQSLDGKTLTGVDGSIAEIDSILLYLAQTYNISPTRMIMNPQEAMNITNKVFNTGGFRVMLQMGKQVDHLTGGTYIERYINKAWQGSSIQIVVDPHVPPGTILGVTDFLPYPDSTIDSVLEIQTLQEYNQFDYAVSRAAGNLGGPRMDYDQRVTEVLKNYFPAGGFVLHNIANG